MKMNKFFPLFLIIFSLNVKAQDSSLPIDESTKLISYTEVVTVNDSSSKDELFSRAKSCFAHLFKSSKNVIQNEDKDSGIIIGKGNIKAHARALGSDYNGGFVNFTITIACKDGRYKYVITDFIHEGTGSEMPSGGNLENESARIWSNKQWKIMKSQTDTEIKNLISLIKSEMSKPTPQNEKW
jgi:hypothetical protein